MAATGIPPTPPVLMTDGEDTVVAESAGEYWDYLWQGYTIVGSAPPPLSSQIRATIADVDAALVPILGELHTRLSDQSIAAKASSNPLNVRTVFGAKGDGSDDTAAFLAAIAFQQTMGGGPIYMPATTASYGFKGELDFSLGAIGEGIGQIGGPGASLGMRTILKRLDGTGSVRVGPGPAQQFGGSFSVYNGGGPVRDFTIDGGDIPSTKELFIVGVVGARKFTDIRIDNIGKGAYGMLVWGAQNCVFHKIQVVNGRSGGMVLDYGAGGNTFDTCNTSRVQIDNEGTALLITESKRTGGTGVYSTSGPSGNKFYNCGFERVQDATLGLTRLLCGLDNTFTDCWWAAGSELTQPNDLVYLGTDTVGGATNTKFHNCKWTGGVSGIVAQTAVTAIHMSTGIGTTSFTGQQSVRQVMVGFRNDGSSGYFFQMDPIWTNVTTKFVVNTGKGPVSKPAYHGSTGDFGFRVETWVASTAIDGFDGYWDVLGPGGAVPAHRLYTRDASRTPEPDWKRARAANPSTSLSTSFVMHPELVVGGLVVGALYEFEAQILYDGPAGNTMKTKFAFPSGSTGWWTPDALDIAVTTGSGDINRQTITNLSGGFAGQRVGIQGIGLTNVMKPSGEFTAGTSGTSLTFQFAQYATDAVNPVTILPGSRLRVRRIG